MMTPGVLLLLQLSTASLCLVVEVSTVGLGGHGATILPRSAPHQLVDALALLPSWTADSTDVDSSRIVELRAADTINIIPTRAAALVELRSTGAPLDPVPTATELEEALGAAVVVVPLELACESAPLPPRGRTRPAAQRRSPPST